MAAPWEQYQTESSNAAPWESYKPSAAPEKTFFDRVSDLSRGYDELKTNMGAGLIRGAGSIGSTLIRPFESATENATRRQKIDDGLRSLVGADTDSFGYGVGKLTSEVLGAGGVGGLLGKGAAAAGLTRLSAALSSGGMSTGAILPESAKWLGAKGTAAAMRLGAGTAVGGASAGLVNPEDAGMGAAIGGAAPFVIQGAGKLGSAFASMRGNKQGKALTEALGIKGDDITKMAAALRASPESIVPGGNLTVAQALQTQNANSPAMKMLERTVSGGRSGNPLLQAYDNQASSRLTALQNQGAQTYQGAASEEATSVGNKLGALLRTQADDEAAAYKRAFEQTHERALQEGTTIQLPIDDMEKAMSPLGRGSVLSGTDANKVLSMARGIGSEMPESIVPTSLPKRQTENLENFVRSMGGMRTDTGLRGESAMLSNRQSGTTGLINNKSGRSSQHLAESAYERGFIAEPDSGVLMQALQGRGGRDLTPNDSGNIEQSWRAMSEQAMGDIPAPERVLKAVPFAEAQRLRRDSGTLAARAAEKGSPTEAGVLANFQGLLTKRFDDAANGNLLGGESVSPGFVQSYNQSRDATRKWFETYDGGNNISSILRKPVGQDYTLTGDKITNKLWHGGAGLAGDVSNFRQALGSNNYEPAMKSLQEFILTDAASKTTASGQFGAALPKYVESRMPGLQEVMNKDQLSTLSSVARDIRNAEAAASVPGLRGSDTQAKIDRALGAGLLDSEGMKNLGKVLSVKGFGLEMLRSKAAESVVKYKGDSIANLLANPSKAAKALEDITFVKTLDKKTVSLLEKSILRAAPILATD